MSYRVYLKKNVFLKQEIFTSNISLLQSHGEALTRNRVASICQEVNRHWEKKTPEKVFEIFNSFHLKKRDYPDLPYPVSDHCTLRICNAVCSFGGVFLGLETLNYYRWFPKDLIQKKLGKREVAARRQGAFMLLKSFF